MFRPQLLILVLLLLQPLIGATTAVRLDLAGLVGGAELVLEGRCLETRAERLGGRLVTRASILVETGYRGVASGGVLEVVVPGGELDGQGLVIPGLPPLRPGQELFLFLTAATPSGVRVPVGLAQGALRKGRDPDSGRPVLRRDVSGLTLVDATGQPVPAHGADEVDLEAFRVAVRAALEALR